MLELTKELNLFGCVFESVRQDISRRADIADEVLSYLSDEIQTIIASAESTQKDSMFALVRLSEKETDVKRLMFEGESLQVIFDNHRKRIVESLLGRHRCRSGRLRRSQRLSHMFLKLEQISPSKRVKSGHFVCPQKLHVRFGWLLRNCRLSVRLWKPKLLT
jgi:hypothetical protein